MKNVDTLRQVLCLLTVTTLMTSCATIFNRSHKDITIYATEPSKIVLGHDTIMTIDNKAILNVARKKQAIKITASTDSLTKNVEVEPKNSVMFWCNLINYGIGMLVDRKNPKRYTYPQRIYLNSADTIGQYFRYGKANNQGEIYLHVSLPHINSFQLTPENERTKINTGFWGMTLGIDYYHSKNQFINTGISGVSDFFVPVLAAVDISGEYELMSSGYISISNNHRLKRFILGYGLSYTKNTWDLRYYYSFDPPPPTRDPIKKKHDAFGLIFPTYYQFGEYFHVGVVYRPTFYRPHIIDKFKYEHLISIDFAWKIRLKK
jgi:hypothetical protein